MSKYLHFGQISPVWLALQVRETVPESNENRHAFEVLPAGGTDTAPRSWPCPS